MQLRIIGRVQRWLAPELGAAVDKWARSQDDGPTRPEAIRRLVEIGLKAKK